MKRQQKCDWLLRNRGHLNSWELDFTATLSAQFEMGDGITTRQAHVLDRTFAKCTLMVAPDQRPPEVVSLEEWKDAYGNNHSVVKGQIDGKTPC